MDLKAFEKSPHIAPLLVRLYESQKIYNLASDKNPLAQVELTGAVAELLGLPLSPREEELLSDVMIALMRQAQQDLRQALAERLSVMGTVPLRLVLHLANDEIQVAAPILRSSPILSDLDLIYIVKAKGSDYWQAVAARESLSPQLIDILANTRDSGTAMVLSDNDRITLTGCAISILAAMAPENEKLAASLLHRTEVPNSVARTLYTHVGQELKFYIRSHYGVTDMDAAIDDVLIEFSDGPRSEFMPSDGMEDAANKYAVLGMLNMGLMMETLQRGQLGSFIALFARYTGLPVQKIHDALSQSCPKGMAIACRAFGIQKADFTRIYLLTNRMRAKDRIVNNADMIEVMRYFDRIKATAAMRIVKASFL